MSYQAIVRNSSDALVQNSPIGMRVTILQGSTTGTPVYVETHSTITNENGLLTIQIGGGTIISGTYENGIFWAGGPYFIKTEIDPLGGTAYSITSTSELLSVPFSNYAHVSGVLAGWSADFVGAYKSIVSTTTVQGYVVIHYLGFDKVSVNMFLFEDSYVTYYATISGNIITFPNDNLAGTYGSGTKNGNNLTINLTVPGPFTFTLNLEKQ
jgi:hypothetical protein